MFGTCTTGSNAYAIGLVLGIIVVASIGGLVEIAPLFTIHETVEDAPDMRRLYAARARGPQHLHPRRLLRLPFADDPHAARRGRTLWPVLARGRVANTTIRCCGDRSAPARTWRGSAASIPTNGMSRISTIRAMCAGIGHAALLAGCCRTPLRIDDLGAASCGAARRRRALYRRDDRERERRCLRPGRHPISAHAEA